MLPEGVVTKLGEVSLPLMVSQRLIIRKVFLSIKVSKGTKRWTENMGKINFCTLSGVM